MSLYRVMCIEPGENTLLHYEESSEYESMRAFFQKPLDEVYLMKVKKAYPDAQTVLVIVEERTESTDWVKKFQRVEFLP